MTRLVVLAGCESSVSGKVSGAVGVEVSLHGPSGKTQVTGRDGTFSFTGLPQGTYTVTPSYRGYSFQPSGRTVELNGSAVSGQDFTAVGHPGVLDTLLGDGGVATVTFPGASMLNAMAVQADGRILLGGSSESAEPGHGSRLHVHRLLADGRSDPAFGSAGGVDVGLGALSCAADALAIQGDGKIVAAGGCNASGEKGTIFLARFEVDGGLDGRFGVTDRCSIIRPV
ncbi:MAG TPA: hypothetical protein VLT82_10150 [Myxococcaceae bacterium]|nr:hypothetical protein [Myxococcaceae bacterium]